MLLRFLFTIFLVFLSNPSLAQSICDQWGTRSFALVANGATITQCLAEGRTVDERFGESQGAIIHQLALYSTDRSALEAVIMAGADLGKTFGGGDTVFMAAIMGMQDEEKLRFLIDAGASVTQEHIESKETPLHRAVQSRQTHAINLILELTDNADPIDEHGWTPLFDAVRASDPNLWVVGRRSDANVPERPSDVVQMLLSAGADPLHRTKSGLTLLHIAARFNSESPFLQYLIDLGIDVNAIDDQGKTALHHAVDANVAPEDIAVLVNAGADLNVPDHAGRYPLYYILHFTKWPELAPPLIDMGMTFNDDASTQFATLKEQWCNLERLQPFVDWGWNLAVTGSDGETLMHYAAARCDDTKDFAFLAAQGVPIDAPDVEGNTPLMVAVDRDLYSGGYRDPAVLEILADLGADPLQENAAGLSPWEIANTNNNVRRHFLAAFDIDLDVPDATGQTLLHRAILAAIDNSETRLVEEYIAAGADVNLADRAGKTPLHVALDHFDPRNFYAMSVLDKVLQGGPDPTVLDPDGQLPVFEWLEKWEGGITFGLAINTELGLNAGQIADLTANLQSSLDRFNEAAAAAGPLSYEAQALEGLLAAPFDIETLGPDGHPILHAAILRQLPPEALAMIIAKGADVNYQDQDGFTVLSMAIDRRFDDAVAILLAAGANPNIADPQGWTALHHLAGRDSGASGPLLTRLMEAGADWRARDAKNRLAIEVAKEMITHRPSLESFVQTDKAIRSFWERWFQ